MLVVRLPGAMEATAVWKSQLWTPRAPPLSSPWSKKSVALVGAVKVIEATRSSPTAATELSVMKLSLVAVLRNVMSPGSRKRVQVPSDVVVALTVVEPFVFQARPIVLEPDFEATGPLPPDQSYVHSSMWCQPVEAADIVDWRTPSLYPEVAGVGICETNVPSRRMAPPSSMHWKSR